MLHQRSTAEKLTGTALVHHADPLGLYQPDMVSMMHALTSKLPTGMHSCIMSTKGHSAWKHHAALKAILPAYNTGHVHKYVREKKTCMILYKFSS